VTGFNRAQLVTFVRAIDRHLAARATVLLVGGAAAAIGYDSGTMTADIDILNVVAGSPRAILAASERARVETGLGVSVGGSPVTELPYDYEDRIKPVRLRLSKLTLLVPDKYDLVLSKTLRGYPHDIDAIEGVHRQHRLSRKVLIGRFEAELVNVATGDPRRTRLNMAMVVARLYGVEQARKLAELWGLPVPKGR